MKHFKDIDFSDFTDEQLAECVTILHKAKAILGEDQHWFLCSAVRRAGELLGLESTARKLINYVQFAANPHSFIVSSDECSSWVSYKYTLRELGGMSNRDVYTNYRREWIDHILKQPAMKGK